MKYVGVLNNDESEHYKLGREAARRARLNKVATDAASFTATLHMPTDDTPLRRQDFFEFDDFLKGFYDQVVNEYEDKIAKLRSDNTLLRNMVFQATSKGDAK